ncbi:hypothetical protein K450DRAFT_216476 [Umbelopsis ramanniana AG]|uniref:Carbohydrate kinase PfkB domain-containing protein n=1 Tax=Umbelopsis ramanniana AG TaxID=1314678 RepID=A0AAD5EJA1_UMBRA|nr:uncharacterized protein K450DRAFT_216476 [Umbelopsis ramanniana AG]KAI8584452.1 hypothetical protein K450DRAFT_216476 [Umbelopsis ramanniana AG]
MPSLIMSSYHSIRVLNRFPIIRHFGTKSEPLLMVVGGAVMDITSTFAMETAVDIKSPSSFLHTSCPGTVRQNLGGVGRNVAEAAYRSGTDTLLVSAVGSDLASKILIDGIKKSGMRVEGIRQYGGETTAVGVIFQEWLLVFCLIMLYQIYNALHSPDGQLISAVADMNVFKMITSSQVLAALESHSPSLVCCDGNLEPNVLCDTARIASNLNIPVHFEPTSIPKSLKIFEDTATLTAGCFKSISPNQHELAAMSNTAREVLPEVEERYKMSELTKHQLDGLPDTAIECLPYALHLSNFFRVIVTKLGEHGCLITGQANGKPVLRYFKPHAIRSDQIKSVTGAGDSFVGVMLSHLNRNLYCLKDLEHPYWQEVIHHAQNAAIRTLQSHDAVGV